jgi:hypothetical protein
MLSTLAQRSRQYVVLGLALYWVLIFTLTHVPTVGLPPTAGGDKAAHVLAYFVLSVFLYSAIAIRQPSQVAPSGDWSDRAPDPGTLWRI